MACAVIRSFFSIYSGQTPLAYGCQNLLPDPTVIEAFITLGADVNSVDDRGETPLHGVARNLDAAVVEILLRHGAQPNVRNKKGDTPLGIVNKLTPKGEEAQSKRQAVIDVLNRFNASY